MADLDVPGWPSGRHAAVQVRDGVPDMPVIRPVEQVAGVPYPLVDGLSPTIGWQYRPQAKGGPAFMVMRRSGLGSLKAVESFPLTEDGWVRAWQSLVLQNPAAVPKILAALQARQADDARLIRSDPEAMAELEAGSLVSLRNVAFLGGYVPGSYIVAGQRYDVRFLDNRLLVAASGRAEVMAELPYRDVEAIEIGGPGLVKTGGGFVGGGFGATGAVEGMAVAAVLNALTTRTSITTIVRIQGTSCELFLLHTKTTPDQLRIELSRPLGAIRSARAVGAAPANQHQVPSTATAPVEQLTKLAEMLEKGLLTRDEFDAMKAKLLGRHE